MYMLRKFFIIAFLFIVGLTPVFAFDVPTCSLTAGECDYRTEGMRCGDGSAGSCALGMRCVKGTDYNCQNGPFHAGRCINVPEYPCSAACASEGNSDGACNVGCADGSYCKVLATMDSAGGVVDCFVSADLCFSVASGARFIRSAVCVEDAARCLSDAVECQDDTDCDPGENCQQVREVDDQGNVIGTRNECVADASTCELPPSTSVACSPQTGCSTGQYCIDDTWAGSNKCADVSIAASYPGICFSDLGQSCGLSVGNSTDFWKESNYCTQGNACMTATSKDWSFSDGTYPTSGICAKCVQANATCTPGEKAYPGSELDTCCDATKRCVAPTGSTAGACISRIAVTRCTADNNFLAPNSLCMQKGFEEFDTCNQCPTTLNGQSFILNANGNKYCQPAVTTDGATKCLTDAGDCGCAANFTCSGAGTCIPKTSCVANEAICSSTGIPACCGSPTYTCREDPLLTNGTFKCLSDESMECRAIGNGTESCTSELEHCCPNDKPYCSAGTCVASFECTAENEGSCCPEFGTICESGSCVNAPDGECIGEDPTLPPAPGYLGPQIEIPQLFSSIGAILYPAGIGIGLFFIVRAGYVIMMSEGNPDEIKRGQEHLTSAIIGTLFIVLSTAILRVIINTLLG